MKFLIRTQVLALLVSFLWIVYLFILTFFNQPGRALQYMNWFVYGFAILFAIIFIFLTKKMINRNRLAVPLVLIPCLILYEPLMEGILLRVVNESNRMTLNFLSLSTGLIKFISIIFGVVVGIMFSRVKKIEKRPL
ncbi:hypothetical protein PH210_03855 [Paenibacillus sp. BSR1-1]|uniref:hypothetical protein n=1 Tax=Paenibacillus sp. BSR1-1 TaxID=3020845 RepID=UPI0025B18B92|nr:hypothetical protein [Paenibacillus sp. BSR1-1]MDN3015342.1 hypothetical protein [Paenibacillus sp. BSR1-1]